MRRSSDRGQAMVETALCMLVFVGILMAGIHLAELGMLSVKVTEASSAAIWDATGRQHHTYGGEDPITGDKGTLGSFVNRAMSDAQDMANGRYDDFQGPGNLGTPPSLVFTRGGELQVTCEAARGGMWGVPSLRIPEDQLGEVYPRPMNEQGRCNASAVLSLIGASRDFAQKDAGGLFDERLFRATSITVCGVGVASGTNCSAGTPILLGDWGMSDSDRGEGSECHLTGSTGGANCHNERYYAAVERVYDRIKLGTAASDLANAIVGSSPIDESEFWFTYRGFESNYQEDATGTHGGFGPKFAVTPGGGSSSGTVLQQHQDATADRRNCWLGFECGHF